MQIRSLQKQNGFTLVEIMIAVSVFSVIMLMCIGSILTVVDSNRKAASLRSVMDNLSFSLDGMTRAIRFGSNYHCGSSGTLSQPLDCASGATSITILDASGNTQTYALSSGQITRSTNNGTALALTSSDTNIQTLSFRVFGSYPYSGGGTTDHLQPQVIIVVKGSVAGKGLTASTFSLETTVSQRKLDYQ